jgi:nicotinamidase-related amidase
VSKDFDGSLRLGSSGRDEKFFDLVDRNHQHRRFRDASAFCEGNLRPLLTEAGIEWLAIAGVWTEACVAATVRDSIGQGFRVLLVKDACGSGTEAMQKTAALNLANRLYRGAVTDTTRAIDLLDDRTVEVGSPRARCRSSSTSPTRPSATLSSETCP